MSASTEARIGTELLGYRIEALLSRGGMGVVYRAYDPRLKRNVALKLVAPELASDERFRERFLVETELAASLEHPHVVPIHDAGEVDGQLYLAMRYVAGSDLKSLLAQEGPLEPKRALALCAQVAGALDAAHERGLVHRDVKPSNVLLDEREHVYLADFGLTRRIAEGGGLGPSLGTPAYAAPEQVEGGEVDGRADVYSLACLLYECLSGAPPFERDSELATLWAQLHDPPPKLIAFPALEPVLAKALAKDRRERYGSCRELVQAAAEALGMRDVVVIRDRRPLVFAALGALLATGALAAGLVLTLGGGGGPKPDLTVRRNMLVRIDPKTSKIGSVTNVGNDPESVAVGGNTVWVHNWKDRTVSEVDARTSALRRTIGIPGSIPLVPAQTIAADASGAWVVSSSSSGGLLTHLGHGPFPLKRELRLPGDAVTIAVGSNAVWVGVKTAGGSAALRVGSADGSILMTIRLGASEVQSMAVGEGALWVLTLDASLLRIDPASGRITGKRWLPAKGSQGGFIAVGRGIVWATFANPPSALLGVDPRTLEVVKTVPPPIVGGGTPNLALGDGAVWWSGTDAGVIWRVDPSSGRIVSTIRITPRVGDEKVLPDAVFAPVGMASGAGGIWVTTALT